MEMEFQKALDECLEKIRQGASVKDCLAAYPEHAAELSQFLTAAAILWDLQPPETSRAGMARARAKLMEAVSAGGKEGFVRGMLRFAHVLGVAFGALFVASIGLVAAAGPGLLTGPFERGHKAEVASFTGVVLSVEENMLLIEKAERKLQVEVTDETELLSAYGRPIELSALHKGDLVYVEARVSDGVYVAAVIKLVEQGERPKAAAPSPTPKPGESAHPEPTPQPEATPRPTAKPTPPPTPKPEPAPAETVIEGVVKSVADGSFAVKNAAGIFTIKVNGETKFEGALAAGSAVRVTAWKYADGTLLARTVTVTAMEFGGAVVQVGAGHILMDTDFGRIAVYTSAATGYDGEPFPGVKVWVVANRQGDGSLLAARITVKMAEFEGKVEWIESGSLGVNVAGAVKTVRTDAGTSYPAGPPYAGANVFVSAYKMSDGSLLAKQVAVKGTVFTGTVASHTAAASTITVQAGPTVYEVCYELADVIGSLRVGVKVEVHVDHVKGSTLFASLVKVLG